MYATIQQGKIILSRFIVSLSAVLLVGGCTAITFHWTKPGYSDQGAEQQLAACQLESEQARYSSEEPEGERTARVEKWTRLCMKAAGWRWLPEQAEPVGGQ